MNWKEDAQNALGGACGALSAGNFRHAVVLLDDAAGVIAQGHLNERQAAPPRDKRGRSAYAPEYWKYMVSSGDPRLSTRQLRMLFKLHELRNLLVHEIDVKVERDRHECLKFLREVIMLARDYGVESPPLILSDVEITEPVSAIVQFDSKLTPARFPRDLGRLAVEYCRRRGILAGIIENIGWPLVRCCLCRRLVSMEQTRITQEDCMQDDEGLDFTVSDDGYFTGEPPWPYCNYGCSRAHQKWMVEEYGDDARSLYSEEYYLQSLFEELPGVLSGQWGDYDCATGRLRRRRTSRQP